MHGDAIAVTDPATGATVDEAVEAGAGGVDAAVAAARNAQPAWAGTPAGARGRVVAAVADAIDAHSDELAPLLTAEQGKPLRESRIELHRCAETLRHYAGLALNIRGAAFSALDTDTRGIVLARWAWWARSCPGTFRPPCWPTSWGRRWSPATPWWPSPMRPRRW
jgi:succinate-semialdehyde dehydrogenase/glutarate-semialdehyde dehydrogenase